ncbi:MAG: hypothetical protein ACO3PY_02620 [Pontimonas sp.]
MAKTFLGGVRLAVAKSGDFIEIKPGADYDAQNEVSDLVSDMLEAAKAHKLRISAFVPEAEGGRKSGYATTWSHTQLDKLMQAGRTPVIMQASKARFPAPYLALLVPRSADTTAKVQSGPDLSRKVQSGPDLSRKK